MALIAAILVQESFWWRQFTPIVFSSLIGPRQNLFEDNLALSMFNHPTKITFV